MPKYLLTNDDGIDAPGITALHQALNYCGIIVAPLEHQSGCGHQVTTDKPIQVSTRHNPCNQDIPNYAIAGTPADCVRIWGLIHIFLARWQRCAKRQFWAFLVSRFPSTRKVRTKSIGRLVPSWHGMRSIGYYHSPYHPKASGTSIYPIALM
jgi:hypothetical protein